MAIVFTGRVQCHYNLIIKIPRFWAFFKTSICRKQFLDKVCKPFLKNFKHKTFSTSGTRNHKRKAFSTSGTTKHKRDTICS